MRSLVLLWSCLMLPGYEALKGPKEISGFEGDSVSLQCTYEKKVRGNRKYWCRQGGLVLSRCSDIVYSSQNQEVAQGRMSIRDSPRQLSMTVTMRDLTLKDSGKYWCGIDRLGFDESFEVSLIVFPAFPGLHPTVATAKQGKTGVKAPVFTGAAPPAGSAGTSQVLPGTSPYAGSSPHTVTPAWSAGTFPSPGTSPHTATSPHAGSSRPVIWLSPTTAKDSKATRVSKSSVSIPVVRMMAPVWVLLSLLLAAGLIAFGSYMLPLLWRKKAWLATETQRNEKVHLAASPPGNTWVPEDAMINLAAPPEYLGNPEPSTVPSTETQHLSQTTEEEAAPPLDAEEDRTAAPPLQISAEELAFSEFISV
ncbi:CMRF35-like molecule 9 isoform X3 [Phodopus roborovskii]|uniref:Cd300lg protein n=1 Tax=Phodopus roborovskii TaxID=109678 RepID=A0AAU9YMU3_PHORO|nr:CMRF35-like molecule 9 isoform X3 [Phodopus roborovskii]CAH6776256.1 Cd300lg [Phodopus roborovskii]